MTTPSLSVAPPRGVVGLPERDTEARSRKICGVLGHELRNPLASVITSLEVIREMTDAEDPRTRFVERALDDLDRVGDLLSSYLEYGRGCQPQRAPQRLTGLLASARDRCAASVVHFATAPDVMLEVDPQLFGRALDNLIENAVAVGSRQVEVRGERGLGQTLLVDVEDDGPGVPEDLRDDVFKAFVSGRGSSGLGLAIVAEVVAAHGGTVSLTGGRLGGSCFRMELPIHEARS